MSALLSGICVGCGCYVALSGVGNIQTRRRAFKTAVPVVFKLLYPFLALVQPLLRSRFVTALVPSTDKKLVQAGLDQTLTAEEYLGLRILYAIVFTFLGGLSITTGVTFYVIFGLIVWIYGLCFPQFWLQATIRKRNQSIQRALPTVLDLLTLSVEAGRDFLTALQDILRNRERDPLGDELERLFREVQLGKQRREALRAMGERVGDPDLSSVVEALVQADELGVSIGSILRILGDQMRSKRFHRAEKLANEAPVKLLMPLILFIFPAVLIVMLGPVLLHSLRPWL